jgi:hypothetical protein
MFFLGGSFRRGRVRRRGRIGCRGRGRIPSRIYLAAVCCTALPFDIERYRGAAHRR